MRGEGRRRTMKDREGICRRREESGMDCKVRVRDERVAGTRAITLALELASLVFQTGLSVSLP